MREWLREKREDMGLTQGQVARAAGMSQQYYSYLENGERGNRLPAATVRRICDALDSDMMWFLSLDGAVS